ncbi:MAG: helix-turn-helix transcriptional regulator [Nocardiopsaceae bacterium]|nr:helix-turn-helix transcriptional regulator [Nocardiopsaceae bacterium]
MNSPTVARRALARILKTAREEAGRTGAQASKYAGIHPGTLSRVENAETKIAPGTAMLLARFYGASEEDCDLVVELARAGRERSWWQRYKSIPTWFDGYIGLETEAREISSYQAELIPGLLQTPDYVRALSKTLITQDSDEEIEQRIALRQDRQKRLSSETAVDFHAVINESALRRRVGGSEAMRIQLAHLVAMSERGNITIQVLSFESGAHAAHEGAFTVMRFPVQKDQKIELPDVTYVEYPQGALYLEEPHTVANFSSIFANVADQALNPEDSVAFIQQVLDEH